MHMAQRYEPTWRLKLYDTEIWVRLKAQRYGSNWRLKLYSSEIWVKLKVQAVWLRDMGQTEGSNGMAQRYGSNWRLKLYSSEIWVKMKAQRYVSNWRLTLYGLEIWIELNAPTLWLETLCLRQPLYPLINAYSLRIWLQPVTSMVPLKCQFRY